MSAKRSLCWLRRDLRLADSASLAASTVYGRQAAVGFVWDDRILSSIKDRSNRRVSFIHRSLLEIDNNLREMGSRLIVRRGDPTEEIPKLAGELKAETVVWGEDYDPSAIERDSRISTALGEMGVEARPVKDIVIFHKEQVTSQVGSPFRIYSPYAKAWHARFVADQDSAEHVPDLSRLIPSKDLPPSMARWDLEDLGFDPVELWLQPGEQAGRERLSTFAGKIGQYDAARDYPAVDGTSHLSVDLRFGTISIRAAVREALRHDHPGARKWLAELIWRDFYQAILFHFPQVVKEPFQKEFSALEYPGDVRHAELWRKGMTGYPIVDAAMRCLKATGYMHNRLRMVVASFFSKDLLLDYRQGEQWFARELLDYELASNNGGWQWASSVGCDAQPYFRIFNPILQSKKFDADGQFIRKWVPELSELSNDSIHFPAECSPFDLATSGITLGETYPWPCVNHDEQRKRAISLLEIAKKG